MMKNEIEARIVYRVQVKGTLFLETPLLIGAGAAEDDVTDIRVLRNKAGQPFIPGTSLAGVLRQLIWNWDAEKADILFGYPEKQGQDGLQSTVCLDDVLLPDAVVSIRDGVCLDEYTGVAQDKAKYDYEVVERGAKGNFLMTWQIRQKVADILPQWKALLDDLVNQLTYGIQLGAMTTKGFGHVRLQEGHVGIYDFSQFADVAAWLHRQPPKQVYTPLSKEILEKQSLVIDADFALKTSLLVRSHEVPEADSNQNVDVVPMMSGRDYLIPGPSVKGVLRHQAVHILQILGKPVSLLDDLMGYAHDDSSKQKSRFFTDEVYLSPKQVTAVNQTRNAIDRFTGSTMDSRLFTEKPLWQKDKKDSVVHLRFAIHDCQPWEAGLALFLLKDLWTGQVALGGDKSVGRGYLQGHHATIRFHHDGELGYWNLQGDGEVTTGDPSELETYAAALQSVTEKE